MAQANTASEFKQDVSRLGEGVQTLKSDMGAVAADAMSAARSGAHQAVDKAKEHLGAAKESAVEAKDSLANVIRRNPLTSIGIAAGVGLLVSLVIFRPRS